MLKRHEAEPGRDRINLVFMGMGEPFLNYDAFMGAVRLLAGPMEIPESRMTVSTSGIVPGILRFAQEKVRPKLAISLNAPNDAVREAHHAGDAEVEHRRCDGRGAAGAAAAAGAGDV